ncbi:glycosyltransferase [Streptomyces sp. P9-2B-2]|uniref:glycosyltransferase family 2 protein n=1 Tax=Streptomyces sp. P9-2B-2 TaxID=3057114 RepID=UPI0025B35FD1|nr:glycosyltransferase [Streptomyces sp. P9-2B-2]WJY38579.1 glycosyltransferase [Streptomyces sp. P9-2B-2]
MPVPDDPEAEVPTGSRAPAPTVSVIVPVHNTRRYLDRSLGSVFAQTLDRRHIEVIAVDDGSTDGSAEWLAEQARRHPHLTVLRQEASGGAGKPRNAGLARATGDYVFFLDSDDRLDPEALFWLTRTAQQCRSDIVYGRIAGADGRAAPVDLRTTSARVSVFDSPVYWSLAAYKLFRRSFVERHRLRFVEGRLLAEDLPFGITALLRADVVSVFADRTCYYLHGREDNSNATRQDTDWCEYLGYIGTVLDRVAAEVPPGADRDKLMVRHFHGEILMPFGAPYLARDPAGRTAMAAAARPLVERHLTDRVLTALPPGLRLRAHCLRAGLDDELTAVVRADTATRPDPPHLGGDGRVYAGYPYFRDPRHALPDACYDLTDRVVLRQRLLRQHWVGGVLHLRGTATLPDLGGDTVEILLRRNGTTHRVPARYADGAWRAAVDPATAADGGPVPDGVWGLKIAVTAYGPGGAAGPALRREAWLVPDGDAEDAGDPGFVPRIAGRGAAGPAVAALFRSRPHGHLNLDLDGDGARRPLGGDLRGTAGRTRSGRATVTARLTLPGCPVDAGLRLVLQDATRTVALRTTAERAAGDRYTVRSVLRGGPPGTWRVALRVTAGPFRGELPVLTAGHGGGGPTPLTLTVPGGGFRAGLRRRARRLRRAGLLRRVRR